MRHLTTTAFAAATLFCSSAFASVPSEDIQLLKDIFKDSIAASDRLLDKAATLAVQPIRRGPEATALRCEELETRISQNYPLHSYETYSGSTGFKPGVKLCPAAKGTLEIFDGEWISANAVKFYYSEQPLTNLLGVKGGSVLTVEYRLTTWRIAVTRQYVLDAQLKIIQFTESREERTQDKKDIQFWTIVSALDTEGNVLSKMVKTWDKPEAEYLWKRSIALTPAKAGSPVAVSFFQNNGKGVEVEQRSYRLPYEWKWDSYEASPLTRAGGLFKVGSETTTWPSTQAALKLYSSAGAACASGYIGYNRNGGAERNFGNENCSAEMDVNTLKF